MVLAPEQAAAMQGPSTVDSIAPADAWDAHWRQVDATKRDGAPWRQACEPANA